MPRRHTPEAKAEAVRLCAAGMTYAKAGAIVGAHRRTVEDWLREAREAEDPDAAAELELRGLPVRLHVEPGACAARLVLRRGYKLVAVLGWRRVGVWDLTPAGDGKFDSLARVLPAVFRRSRASAPLIDVLEEPASPCALATEMEIP